MMRSLVAYYTWFVQHNLVLNPVAVCHPHSFSSSVSVNQVGEMADNN